MRQGDELNERQSRRKSEHEAPSFGGFDEGAAHQGGDELTADDEERIRGQHSAARFVGRDFRDENRIRCRDEADADAVDQTPDE